MERVSDPADPRRCVGQTQSGQCRNFAEQGDDRCRAHAGVENPGEKRMYLLHKAQHQKRLTELSSSSQLTSLREEIGILRMLIEERLNLVKTDNDLLSAFGPLQQSFVTVERLVKTLHSMEQDLGLLLNKSAVVKLGQSLSQIIVEELRDVPGYEQLVDRINERMLVAIAELQNTDDAV